MAAPTHAVILAAGRGTRLGSLTRELPKPLLPLGDTTLIGRQLDQITAAGIETITIATGHQSDLFRRELGHRWGHAAIRYTVNPDFAVTGSAVTLVTAWSVFTAGETVLMTHGDIAYHDEILSRCLEAPGSAVVAADRGWEEKTGDEVLIWSDGGTALGLVKGDPGDLGAESGEFIGVDVFDAGTARAFALHCAARTADDPSLNYELPLLADFAAATGACRVSYTDSAPWINVNYTADLDEAQRLFAADHRR